MAAPWRRMSTHWGLYLCLFALPLSGWLMSSASAYSVSWFNLIQLPDLVGPDEALKGVFGTVHEALNWLLVVLASLHIAAAFKHLFVDKDEVMSRMVSVPAMGVAAGLLMLGIVLLWPAAPSAEDTGADAGIALPLDNPVPGTTANRPQDIEAWHIDYEQSVISFSGEQAGAPFTGYWTDWLAQVRFDPDRLAQSWAEVTIQTSGVDTSDGERDSTIRGAEFFDVEQFGVATFRADAFQPQDAGFVTDGMLTIKGLSLPVQFVFTVTEQPGGYILKGTATIDRLAFAVGTGDWQDVSWVGQYVEVAVEVVATR